MRKVMKKAEILLVDGDKLFRSRVRHMLEQEEDMEIVGDCDSAEEVQSQVETLFPNIVLMDTHLPGMDGIEACRWLTGNGCACDVIMLTKHQELIDYGLKAGAVGYYPKEIKQEALATAIRLACQWQSLKAKSGASIYSIRQMEAMIMENLTQFTAEETPDKDEPEWLPPKSSSSSNPVPEVTLVVPSPGDASQLQRFICRVEETLQASLLETVGSWRDTHLTLKLRRHVPLADMLDKLVKMPEVEAVEEKTPVKVRRFGSFKKIEAMPRQRLLVTLRREAQPLTAAGQANQYLGLPGLQPQMSGVMVS